VGMLALHASASWLAVGLTAPATTIHDALNSVTTESETVI
jgi:hypothetical protein